MHRAVFGELLDETLYGFDLRGKLATRLERLRVESVALPEEPGAPAEQIEEALDLRVLWTKSLS